MAGGLRNVATNQVATVAGGSGDTAAGAAATVGGGADNQADGNSATVSGGGGNLADGTDDGGRRRQVPKPPGMAPQSAVVREPCRLLLRYHSRRSGNRANGEYAAIPGGLQANAWLHGQIAHAVRHVHHPRRCAGRYLRAAQPHRKQHRHRAFPKSALQPTLTVEPGQAMVFDVLIVALP